MGALAFKFPDRLVGRGPGFALGDPAAVDVSE